MAEFTMAVKGEGVEMTPEQLDAITKFGGETGGTVEVHATEGPALRVVPPDGREFFVLADGNFVRPS